LVALKYLKDVAKRNNIQGYSKLRKEDLKTLLRNRLPKMVYEEIMESGTTRSLLDDDIPEMSQQPLKPRQHVPPPKKEGVTRQTGRWLG